MSAVAALRGYRTQFLYSLHYILASLSSQHVFRLEGEEDLDILDSSGQLLYAIQLKNLAKPITLSDILSENKTSFIKRFLSKYPDAVPVLVSYSEISQELKNWAKNKNSVSSKEKAILKKYNITPNEWNLVKSKTEFKEITELQTAEEVERMIKNNFPEVDPIPTAGFLLNWLQFVAEKQLTITTKDFYSKIQDFATYITERTAVHDQFGIVLKPLHKISVENVDQSILKKEFYNATLTRYEHILLGLDVNRVEYFNKIKDVLKINNTVILKGASGQGKTALLYSFICNYTHDWLSYELNIQQDAVLTQQSIQAVASISKKLEIPAVFVINVNPNSTDWLATVKESSHLNHIRFLVAVRNEDWYRASEIGIEFDHSEIELTLSKTEAEIIYSKVNERSIITHFTDFEQAWIQLDSNAPMLEFVYSITQGGSLGNKLKQQVQQLVKQEGSLKQDIELLRVVCLADSIGARVDVSKLDSSIGSQFIIERLENEYLVKKSDDKKYIQGLHMIRSKKLVEILFDEFTVYKEQYAYKCIDLVDDEDLYLFLLQMFQLGILRPDQVMKDLNSQIKPSAWPVYCSLLKSLIWLGIFNYVETNRVVIDECRLVCGGAWTMFADFMFGSNYDRQGMLNVFPLNEDQKEKISRFNKSLSPKYDVFNLAAQAINKLDLPETKPLTALDWKSYGEVLFWLKNILNKRAVLKALDISDYEFAFKNLDSRSLAKLMLGMYSYSEEMDAIRKGLGSFFIEQIKKEFDVIHIEITETEVYVHYIIDILKNDAERFTNDYIVNILNIIRTALPDKKKFNSQGYGHRLQTLAIDLDATHKAMPVENMPLEEWININSTIVKLYDYKNRPEDWNEYRKDLNQWELGIKNKICEFNASFAKFFKEDVNYMAVVPVMQNIGFEKAEKIKEPKSITDPLGIYWDNKKGAVSESYREERNEKLKSKYELFFKSISDFKSSIESFIQQSGSVLYSNIKQKTDQDHRHNSDIQRLSQINLYNAIEKLQTYNLQYSLIFSNTDQDHLSKIEANELFSVASFWKDFLNNNFKGNRSEQRIFNIKSDFENKLCRLFKQLSKNHSFSVKYINNKTTNNKPVILIDGESLLWAMTGFKEAYGIIHDAIDKQEYTSLKYLMLQVWFPDFYFIQTIRGKTLKNEWNQIKLYIVREKLFEELSLINTFPRVIERQIVENFNIESWTGLYPEFSNISKAIEAFSMLQLLVDHFHDLELFDKIDLTLNDKKKLQDYCQKIGAEMQESFQTVLDSLKEWMDMFPFVEESYINSEEEQEFFQALQNIGQYIFPEPKGDEEDYQLLLNMEVIAKWSERLKVCSQSWGILILLLYAKYIEKYKAL